jgi:hypothetical protein
MMMKMMIVEGVAYSDLVMTEEHKEKSVPALFVLSKIPGIVLGLNAARSQRPTRYREVRPSG